MNKSNGSHSGQKNNLPWKIAGIFFFAGFLVCVALGCCRPDYDLNSNYYLLHAVPQDNPQAYQEYISRSIYLHWCFSVMENIMWHISRRRFGMYHYGMCRCAEEERGPGRI